MLPFARWQPNIPTLRDYQEPCVEACVRFFLSKQIQRPKIVVAPTAAGKSIIIAATAARLPGKVLVLQPSAELLVQNYTKYLMYDSNCSAFSASVGQKRLSKVVFATIGSIVKYATLFNDFEHLIIDECHAAPSRDENQLGVFLAKNPQLKILGLTATAFRLLSGRDTARLVMLHNNKLYNGYQYIIQIQDIAKKYWAPINYIFDHGDKSVLRVKDSGAEYTDISLKAYGRTIETQLKTAIQKHLNEPMLVFMPSVDEAKKMAKLIPGSACVYGEMPKPLRKKVIDDFKSGKIMRIFNYQVLGIGFDHPGLMVLIDAVPTMSLAKHYQKVGRLTRPHPDGIHIRKTYIDLAENTRRFGYMEELRMEKVGSSYHFFSNEKQLTGKNLAEISVFDVPERIIPTVTIPSLFEDMKIQFGKFRGRKISEIPEWYLKWAIGEVDDDRLVSNMKKYLERKKQITGGKAMPRERL